MLFNQPRKICLQIANQVLDRIASGDWKEGDKIPSLRESATSMGVNPNTVARAYQSLLDSGIIETRRGIGYFIKLHARELVINRMKKHFIEEELPRLFEAMNKLDIGIEEFSRYYNIFKKGWKNENKSKNNAVSNQCTSRDNSNGDSSWSIYFVEKGSNRASGKQSF